ncbi:MAG TPA: hypothetical protein IGS53_26310 [Leptolyngbyaceae cyanobacterium M33_DOE_097]|nr:hypothetical protein [Leptolyngbyaceae cyanobacterium M33_DOE_097]
MDAIKASFEEYTKVRRILAGIAIANDKIDDEERKIIVSSIGEASSLTEEQLKVLIGDVTSKPDVMSLASEITQPIFLKQLMVDLIAFALMKNDWYESEVNALKYAISGMKISDENRGRLVDAIELLRNISSTL